MQELGPCWALVQVPTVCKFCPATGSLPLGKCHTWEGRCGIGLIAEFQRKCSVGKEGRRLVSRFSNNCPVLLDPKGKLAS